MASSSVLPFLLLLLLPQSFTTAQSPPQKISPDGSCAGSNGYTCKGSNFGDSCGRYNLCGRDYSYSKLSQGCQPAYGYCVPKGSVSPDGSCGGSDMFTCLGSTFGSSCSRNNQCGRDVGYSGAGCQPDFGFCQTCSVSAQPSTVIIRTTVTSTIQKLSTTATTSTVRSGVTTSLATISTTATSVSTSVENRVVPSQLPPIFTTSVRLTTITIPLFTTQIVATTTIFPHTFNLLNKRTITSSNCGTVVTYGYTTTTVTSTVTVSTTSTSISVSRTATTVPTSTFASTVVSSTATTTTTTKTLINTTTLPAITLVGATTVSTITVSTVVSTESATATVVQPVMGYDRVTGPQRTRPGCIYNRAYSRVSAPSSPGPANTYAQGINFCALQCDSNLTCRFFFLEVYDSNVGSSALCYLDNAIYDPTLVECGFVNINFDVGYNKIVH